MQHPQTAANARRQARVLGFLVLADGREQPIDEAMIDLALSRIDADGLSLHGREHEAALAEEAPHGCPHG